MPNKKELAGSAKNGVAKNKKIGSGNCNSSENNLIAELIEQIEVGLAAIDLAGATDAALTDMPRPCRVVVPIEQCHASISYVCRHQALSINLFWGSASPADGPDAGEGIEQRRQPEAAKI